MKRVRGKVKLTFRRTRKVIFYSPVTFLQCVYRKSYLIVVRAVGGLLHRRVLLIIPYLHTHHRVHVEANQLPGLDYCDANLMGDVNT